jgi:hypothetical protein
MITIFCLGSFQQWGTGSESLPGHWYRSPFVYVLLVATYRHWGVSVQYVGNAIKCRTRLTLILLMWRIGWAPNSIPIYIQQDGNITQFIYIWKLLYMFRVVLPPVIRSAFNRIYSIWYLSHRYCYLPLSWKSWNWFECAVGGVRHPQHTQTGSNW